MKTDPILQDLDDFQSPLFIVGQTPERLGEVVKPLIAQAMKRDYSITVVSSFDNFRDLAGDGNFVYHTSGKFGVAPIAINCFEVPGGIPVVSHAYQLASIVGTIWDLSDKDITDLRSAIEKAYVRRGWNLLTNSNFRTDTTEYQPELFPNWHDILQHFPKRDEFLYDDLDEMESARDRPRAVVEELVGPVNSLVFAPGKVSMKRLSDGNHVCEISVLLPQAQLLSVWCIGLWKSATAKSRDPKRKDLLVVNFSPETSSIQEASSRGPMIFSCADQWSTDLDVLTVSRPWGLRRAYHFEHGAKIIRLESDAEESSGARTKVRLDDQEIRKHWLASDLRIEPMVSYGEKYLPQAFLAELYGEVSALLANEDLYRIYVRYLLAIQNDPVQLVHYRSTFIDEISMLLGRRMLSKIQVTWLVLSLFTDRFFQEKSERHSWSLEEEVEMRDSMYKLLVPVFVSADVSLRLEHINSFRQRLSSLQEIEVGPYQGCRFCNTRCQFGHAVSTQMTDSVIDDLNASINISQEPASYSMAWSARLRSESWIDASNLASNLNLAYCIAVHHLEASNTSRETSLVILYKIREELNKFEEDDEIDPSESESPDN